MNIMIINGPSLNLLGIREPNIYGSANYQTLEATISEKSLKEHFTFTMHQTNHEGMIIDLLQRAYFENYDAVIINPGAYTHYSYAIFDAIKSIPLPCVEVHLSDISKREDFRSKSVTAPACICTFKGEHFQSYLKAIDYILRGNQND